MNSELPGKVLIRYDNIVERVRQLAEEVESDLQSGELVVIGALNGCFFFITELLQYMNPLLNPTIDFVHTSSYKNNTVSSGKVKLLSDINTDIGGKQVLIVDDIVDTALTMSVLVDMYKKRNPSSIKTCVLLNKPARRQVDFVPDYSGFDIDDVFVFGHGLDPYRNLKDIYAMEG